MKVTVSEAARADAREAARFYDDRVPGLGDRFDILERAFARIGANPLGFGLLETVPKRLNIRRALLQPFSYYVVFQV